MSCDAYASSRACGSEGDHHRALSNIHQSIYLNIVVLGKVKVYIWVTLPPWCNIPVDADSS